MLNDPKKAGRAHGCCTFPFTLAPGGTGESLRRLGAPLLLMTRLGPAGGGWHPWVHGCLWDRGGSQSWSICPRAGRSQPPSSAVGEAACVAGETHGDTARPRLRGTQLSKHPALGAGLALPRHGGDIGQSCPRTHSNGTPGWPCSRQPHSTWPLGHRHPWGIVTLWGCHPARHHHPRRHHHCMGHQHPARHRHPVGHHHPMGHRHPVGHHHPMGHRHPARHRHPVGHHHPMGHCHPTRHQHPVGHHYTPHGIVTPQGIATLGASSPRVPATLCSLPTSLLLLPALPARGQDCFLVALPAWGQEPLLPLLSAWGHGHLLAPWGQDHFRLPGDRIPENQGQDHFCLLEDTGIFWLLGDKGLPLPAWGHGHFHLLGDKTTACLLGDTILLCLPARGHSHLLAARDSVPPPVPLGRTHRGTSMCSPWCRQTRPCGAGAIPRRKKRGQAPQDRCALVLHPPWSCTHPGRAPPVAPSSCPWTGIPFAGHHGPRPDPVCLPASSTVPKPPGWGTAPGWLPGLLAWLS